MRRPRASTLVRVALTPIAVWAIYLLKANVWFRLYPAVMAAIAFAVFAVTLSRASLLEAFARVVGEKLDVRGTVYCRVVVWVWTCFLATHFVVTVLTIFASDRIWVIYNGLVAYLLMGGLFVGEWIVRRRLRRG